MRRFDRIYLSPHLDDAVFSCGGRIRREVDNGLTVLVATVATADAPAAPSPLAERFHHRAGLAPPATPERRAEDRAAAAELGAELLHLGLADAVYRHHPRSGAPLYPSLASLLRRPHPADTAFDAALTEAVAALPERGLLLAPLAIGGHVDHRLTRRAAEAAAAESGRLELWEDFPYLLRWPGRGRRRPRGAGWRPYLATLPPAALAARCRAMAAYGSQVPLMFGDAGRMRRLVERTVERTGGERYWRPPPTTAAPEA